MGAWSISLHLTMNPNLRLSPKQRAFCHAYVRAGGNGPEAALQAYDCSTRNSARVMSFKCLHNPAVQQYLGQRMLQSGVVEKAMNYLLEALQAEHKGMPDWQVRSRAADQVFRIAGAYDRELTKG